MRRRLARWSVVVLAACALAAAGCGRREAPPAAASATPAPAAVADDSVLTLGDVDPGDPAGRARRMKPLADYLAAKLRDHGVTRGDVAVARDIPEMVRMVQSGVVDVQLSSPVPILRVREATGSRIVLRRWVDEQADYWTVFFARQGSAIASLDQLRGKVIGLKDPTSTSGYLLPAAHLVERGFKVRQVILVNETMAADEVGLFLAGSEQNEFEAVTSGLLPAAATSNQELDALPQQLRDQLVALDRTVAVPRALVAVRQGLDGPLEQRLEDLLLGLTDVERTALQNQDGPMAWTWRFDRVTPEAEATLARLADLTSGIDQVR